MKILLIHNKYQHKGGEDMVVKNEFNLLRENGYDVKSIIFNNERINSLKEKFLSAIWSIYNPASAKILENKISKFKPDVIHIHNFFPLASPSIFFVAKKYNIPVIVTLHNYRLICANAILYKNGNICEKCTNKIIPVNGILNKCYKDSYLGSFVVTLTYSLHKILRTWEKKVDKFIVLTEFQKNKLLNSSLKLPSDKFIIKPNFVEDRGEGLKPKNRNNYFLYVGRLTQEKGIKTLLKTFSKLSLNIKIVGEGPLKNLVIDYSKKYKNISYLGFKKQNEIIELMKKSQALIFTSEWYEGFPMVLVESLSTGTPVITSNIGSQASIIKDRETGLHFEVGNPYSLRTKIMEFINFKNKERLYTNSRKEYLENYTPEKNFQMLISIYREVINATKKKNT